MPTLSPTDKRIVRNVYDLSVAHGDHALNDSSVSSSMSMAKYSYGLNGVNVFMDNKSSQTLYVAIGIIFVAITILRLLQRSNAHLRQLTTYGSKDKQFYWQKDQSTTWAFLKRHLIYAPLRHIRHNKEIQLSRALNVGTLPGRFHFVLLILFVLSQIAFMTILNYDQPWEATVAELRGRSGHLAVMNMLALFVMAGRNNPFIRILRVSFDTFNLFHRWIGRIIIIESIVHIAAWGRVKTATSSWGELTASLVHEPFLTWGLVSTIAMIFILLHSPAPIRHAFYETFLCLHQLFAFIVLIGVFYHGKLGSLPQMGFIIAIVLIWSYDRLFRFARIFYYNFSFGKGFTRVSVEALPGEACRVTFFTPRPLTPRAGSHVYAYLPSLGWWQSHPFSVAWTTSTTDKKRDSSHDLEKCVIDSVTATSLSLVVSARTGMTKKLHEKAMAGNGNRITITGFVEGPYGSLETLHSYGSVLLFAGGVGITHQLSHIRDLVKGYADKTMSIQKLTLIWTIRNEDSLEWVRPWMDEILCMPGRRDVLTIKIYVTKPKNGNLRTGSNRVQMLHGRPRINDIVQTEFVNRVGAMSIGVCGPGALADDVRRAAREVVDQGKVDFYEEAFTW